VDVSPPVAGVVLDNRPDGPDLDFVQTGSTLYASFEGFHDPESGIRYFLYAVGASCQTDAETFLAGSPSKQTAATGSSITYIAYRCAHAGWRRLHASSPSPNVTRTTTATATSIITRPLSKMSRTKGRLARILLRYLELLACLLACLLARV